MRPAQASVEYLFMIAVSVVTILFVIFKVLNPQLKTDNNET